MLLFLLKIATVTTVPFFGNAAEDLIDAQERSLKDFEKACEARDIDWSSEMRLRLRRPRERMLLKAADCPALVLGAATAYALRDVLKKPIVRDNTYYQPSPEDAAILAEIERLDKKAGIVTFVEPPWLDRAQQAGKT